MARLYRRRALCHPDRPHEAHGLCRKATCHPEKPRYTESGLCSSCNHDNYYSRNKQKVIRRTTEWQKTHPEKHKQYKRKYMYGITNVDFNKKFEEQKGLCAICRNKPAICVDHDHTTRQIRGLLCKACNSALGHFLDSVDTIENAASYLRFWRNHAPSC